ncbi:unnamed protein product [Vitrella brassicaformis CCMP3155]|uniref:Uncharacterized protein n=1 Tax=Vitrella brassicaformis (strain CCMP3155) TaxID=1169540 RepID=A0A0G4H6U2_VITBC|nr:unnamed protein product [Vitrella brassicaformis CCMP3155]|eukprot:CEM39488.1 unnamed protein product [Vitrella brassicaformis CCMP3155]
MSQEHHPEQQQQHSHDDDDAMASHNNHEQHDHHDHDHPTNDEGEHTIALTDEASGGGGEMAVTSDVTSAIEAWRADFDEGLKLFQERSMISSVQACLAAHE